MASGYSNLKIELIGTGDQDGTWGYTTNTNLGTAIDEAISGNATIVYGNSDVTLTLTNSNNTQTARNIRLVLVVFFSMVPDGSSQRSYKNVQITHQTNI